MFDGLAEKLAERSFFIYKSSLRTIDLGSSLFVAVKDGVKFVGLVQSKDVVSLKDKIDIGNIKLVSGEYVSVYPFNWYNYLILKEFLPISPVCCDKSSSFGTGDRLGMVTAAHLEADIRYPVFPIIAQQSPRELERTNRDFKDVLLKAVIGVLETGYSGSFGADADHIKDEKRFMEGVEAGFSMYTLDVSDDLQDISKLSDSEIAEKAKSLADESKKIISDFSGKTFAIPEGEDYIVTEGELVKSALVYEQSMRKAVKFYTMAKTRINALDLEVSIDEGSRDTTAEDHIFVAEFLHRNGVDFRSLAPKFPGEFQKAVDYRGDFDKLNRSFNVHAEIARQMKGYRLSMHSGSDKFSVYKMFGKATRGNFHIKTSGTSWLQAVKLVCYANPNLFSELYEICIETLPESKKAYHVDITQEHFPTELPDDIRAFYANPDVQQLFHISYGALLDRKKDDIIQTLIENEQDHYQFVTDHINKHLQLLFED
ncbi:MAG: tagaturonate epimerase family protein [Armatimonadota bacterium]